MSWKTIAISSFLLALGGCTKARDDEDAPGGGDDTTPAADGGDDGPVDTSPSGRDDGPGRGNADAPTERRDLSPPALHLLYWRGDLPERRTLIHAVRQSEQATWQMQVLARSTNEQRFHGSASLGLDANERPHVTVLRQTLAGLERPQLDLMLVDGTNMIPLTGDAGLSAPTVAGVLRGGAEPAIVMTLTGMDGKSRLIVKRLSGDLTPADTATDVLTDVADAYVADADITDGGLQIAYIEGARLHHRIKRAGQWLPPTSHDVDGCEQLHMLATVFKDGQSYNVHTCTYRRTDGRKACRLGLSHGSLKNLEDAVLGPIDAARGCGTFNVDRPALAVDDTGRVHVAYRSRIDDVWRVTYTSGTPQDGFEAPVSIGAAGPRVGAQRLAIDALGHRHIAWFDGQGLQLATASDQAAWQSTSIPLADGINDAVITLADFDVSGGAP